MERLDLKFLVLGAGLLLVGVSLGIYMGIVHDFQLAPVHAHLNLVGFVSCSLFGVVYRLYPDMARSRIATIHFILAAPAALLFPFGIALSILKQQPMLAVIAAILWFGGSILFFIQIAARAFVIPTAPTLAAAD